ncbi:MAG: HAMP domain-containing histidine kinase [Bacteroides sp.]|nr:HAMP domain-containing histidine kinase [Bacteroides sp.]MCM1549444.1 HAMP domain-containing histidine kinase [Clostridium sp.]
MKFRYKITCCMVSLLALFYGIGGTLMISISFQSALEQEKANAYHSYEMILNTLQIINQMDSWTSNQDISNVLGQLSEQNHSNWDAIRLISISEPEVLYRSGRGSAYFQDVRGELDSEHCLITQFSDDSQKQFLQMSSYVQVGSQQLLLDVAYDISSIYESRQIQETTYYRIYFIMLAVCLLVVYMTTYLLTRPLNSLSKVTRHIASGNYAYRSMIRSNDEIGRLSEDFNTMAERVEDSVETMQRAMEQQEEFMGSFAHELKTPMTSIIGYADLIRRQTMSPAEEADAANYIFTEGKRLERLSLKMLDIFSMNHKEIPFSFVSPAHIIENLVEDLKPVYNKAGIRLSCDCEAGSCLLEPDLFRSLLLNLVDNSRKAIKGEGIIRITSTMQPDGCRILVADNGEGIPEAALEHLTEAFYRVDKARSRKQGGAGLGLTLCAKIVAIHHGTMAFQANGGQGLQVRIELKGGRGK